jgi:hypothetical protein
MQPLQDRIQFLSGPANRQFDGRPGSQLRRFRRPVRRGNAHAAQGILRFRGRVLEAAPRLA